MADMRANVLLSLNNRLSGGIKTAGRDMNSFARGASGALSRVDRALSGTIGKISTIGGGLGLAVTAKQTIDLEKQMVRLGTQAGVSAQEVEILKKQIFAVSRDQKIKIDPSQLLGAVDSIIERTGDLDFARDNLESIAMAIQASGAEGVAIGGLYAEFQKMGLGADAARQAIDTLTIQGKNGAFTLENLASLGPRVINAYTATGRSGAEALTEMGAALQVIRKGTGSSEQAATSFEALMRNLVDPTKQKKLKTMGVSVYDTAGKFRSVTDLMNEIVSKSEGDLSSLGTIFDSEAMRAFNSAISEFQRSGAVSSLGEFMKMQGDGSTIMQDSARNAKTMAANLEALKTGFQSFADKNLSEPLEKAANVLNSVTPEQFDVWMHGAKNIALGFAALKGISVTAGALGAVSSMVASAKGRSAAGQLASGIGGAAGAVPVFVTNMGAGGMGVGGAAGKAVGTAAATRSMTSSLKAAARQGGLRGAVARGRFINSLRLTRAASRPGLLGASLRAGGKAAKFLGGKGNVAMAGLMTAGEIAMVASNKNISGDEKARRIGGSAASLGGYLAGGAAGAKLGAAIGTAIAPGVGTAIGAAVGGIGGGIIASFAARKAGEKAVEGVQNFRDAASGESSSPAPPVIKNEFTIQETAEGYRYMIEAYANDQLISTETGQRDRSILQ